ncbi:MAG: AMP-binding protein [Terriglobales bacterium]|jgi:acyl-CoA synthetase (AMP-forming)/AMP-acid ligase II
MAGVPYKTLIDALHAAPAERPFVTEWVNEDEQETVTFGEFRARARAQAARLRAHGVEPGDRVVIIMPQGIAAMTVFAGAMLAAAAPAFIAYPNDKVEAAKYRSGLAGVTANLKAKVVVIDDEFPEEMREHVRVGDGSVVVRAGRKDEDELGDSDGSDSANLDSQKSASRKFDSQEFDPRQIDSGSVAFIQHSAGTTGLQKGVALTHAAVLRQLDHLAKALSIESRDRIYSWLPLYHDMGLIACFMLPMVYHLPLVMQSPIDWVMVPETMLAAISQHKCTLAWMPNFAFQFIPRRTRPDRRAEYDLSSVRALINCSEPVRARSMREFEEAFAGIGLKSDALQSSYAMAENVFAVTQSPLGAQGPPRLWADAKEFRGAARIREVQEQAAQSVEFVSSGRLLPNHEIRIVADDGKQLEDGRVGEILVKSDCLFEGYYNRPDLTAEAIVAGWYHTGDLGFCWEQELYVVGRKKDLIIVGGENLYPQDIEEIAGRHAAVHDGRVIAMGLYNPSLGTEEIVVVAEVENEALLDKAEQIEREIREQVAAGMGVTVPTIFLKPPKWIVKSTAGKAARSSTLEKLGREHPEWEVD